MLVAIIILAWFLINTWIALAIVCVGEGYHCTEWIGIIIACVFSPLMIFIIRPIVLFIKKTLRKRKK